MVSPQLKNLAAIIACFFVGYCCARSYAQGTEPSCSPSPDDPARSLVQQLWAPKAEDRERAATALQAMGINATKVLADRIDHEPSSDDDTAALTKAVTILGKIGSDIADDSCARNALLHTAKREGIKRPVLGLRLAAIDALGEINKYRSAILTVEEENAEEKLDLSKVVAASVELAEIAEQVFASARTRSAPTPTPTPPDTRYYRSLKDLQDSQRALVKLAAQVNAAAPPSNKKKPAFPKLADAKTLAASLRRIEVGYSDATKTIDAQKLKLENAYDKTGWQFQTEAAYDLVSEVTELKSQLDLFSKAVLSFTKNRDALKSLVSDLATIPRDSNCDQLRAGVSDLATISRNSNCDQLRAGVASALNRIFSKSAEKKLPQEVTKKEEAKKTAAGKDSEKNDSDKKDAAKDDAGKEESTNDE